MLVDVLADVSFGESATLWPWLTVLGACRPDVRFYVSRRSSS